MTVAKRFRSSLPHACLLLLAAWCFPSWAADGACAVPAGLRQAFQPASAVLMGELHGTAEAPAAFGAAVCSALEAGFAVSAGLELNADQTGALANYLASEGGKADVERLLGTPFWSRAMQDGRSSVAMLALIERLRQLQRRYPALAVFSLYDDLGGHGDAGSGDAAMAARVRAERLRRPQALILTLSGNVHNRLAGMTAGGQRLPTPMGMLLADLAPRSVLLMSNGGSAWVCTPDCGIQAIPDLGTNAGPGRPFRAPAADPAYSAEWSLGPSTASPPAALAVAR